MAVAVVTDAAALAPENTLAAFEAGRVAGADALHVDLRLTADRHVVALRDATVDATTDGTGAVGGLDLADLRRLDAGSWFAPEHAGARIPTLDDVLALAAPHDVGLVLHLRGPWLGIEAALVTDPVLDAGLGGRVTVLSAEPTTLAAVAAAEPDLPRALELQRTDPEIVSRCLDLGATAAALTGRLLVQHAGLVDRLHDAGLGVLGWALDEPALWSHATRLGVDAIVTHRPERLGAWLGRREPRVVAA
jgi:glycerophosphoryl diester phosphodiesterase